MKVKGLAIDDDLFYVSHDKVAFLVFNEYQLTVSQRRHILCYDGGLPCYVYVLEDILIGDVFFRMSPEGQNERKQLQDKMGGTDFPGSHNKLLDLLQ